MRAIAITLVALVLVGCGRKNDYGVDYDTSAQVDLAIQSCIEKGVAYFKEIESYPTLSDGRDAREVAGERCNRTTGAFDGLDG